MNNMKQLFIAVLLISSIETLFGAAGRDMKINPQTMCIGPVSGSCTIQVPPAEVGDQVEFDTTGVPVEALGTIEAEKSGKISVPLVNKMQIISFVPQGDTPFKGQEIKLLLASFDVNNLPAGAADPIKNNATKMKTTMRDDAKTMISAYRQLPGEKLWTEFGTTGLPLDNLADADQISYIVMPNGQFIIKTQYLLKGVLETYSLSAGLGQIG